MEDNHNARSTVPSAAQKADTMDEEEKQGKLHDTLQQVLSLESASHEALDSRIKGVTQGDDFSYRTIMTMINFTRTFGQADGMSMMLSQESSDKNESVSAVNSRPLYTTRGSDGCIPLQRFRRSGKVI